MAFYKGLRNVFCGTLPFQEKSEIPELYLNISVLHDQAQKQEIKCLWLYLFTRSTFF